MHSTGWWGGMMLLLFFVQLTYKDPEMAERKPVTYQGVPDRSVPFPQGAAFYHDVFERGKKKPIARYYMMEKDGKFFPMMYTADAAAVLPIALDGEHNPTGVWLLRQGGRTEVKKGTEVLKLVGGFCFEGEARVDAAVRVIGEKFGVTATIEDLINLGEPAGYGPQFDFSGISIYALLNPMWNPSAIREEGCEAEFYRPDQLAELLAHDKLFCDDANYAVGKFLAYFHYPNLRPWTTPGWEDGLGSVSPRPV